MPYGINASGQIVGYYFDGSGNEHGFSYNGSTYTTIEPPLTGPDGSFAFGINDAGQIVGYGTYNGANRAFLLTP